MSDFLLVKIIHLYTLRAFEVISPMSPLKTVIVKILLIPTSKHFCCQMYLHTLFVRDSSSILPVTFLPNNFFVLWLGRLVSFTLLSFLRPCPSYMIQCPPVSVCAGSHAPFLFLMSAGCPRRHLLRRLFPVCLLCTAGAVCLCNCLEPTVQLDRQGKGVSIDDEGGVPMLL